MVRIVAWGATVLGGQILLANADQLINNARGGGQQESTEIESSTPVADSSASDGAADLVESIGDNESMSGALSNGDGHPIVDMSSEEWGNVPFPPEGQEVFAVDGPNGQVLAFDGTDGKVFAFDEWGKQLTQQEVDLEIKLALEAAKEPTQLVIVNGLTEELKLVAKTSEGIADWTLDTVAAAPAYGEFKRTTFSVSYFDYDHRGYATATYQVGSNPEKKFTVELTYCEASEIRLIEKDGACLAIIDVSPSMAETTVIFPHSFIGFQSGRKVDLVISERVNPQLTPPPPQEQEGMRWMERLQDLIGPMKWTDLTLAGTHNSGSNDPVAWWAAFYTRNQLLPVQDQLRLGTRVLDIRTLWKKGKDGAPDKWLMTHGQWAMNQTVEDFFEKVKAFIDETSKELVMLDFHSFEKPTSEKANIPLRQLKNMINETFKDYLIPVLPKGVNSTMNEIWESATGTKRVMVSFNYSGEAWMWPRVDQKWFKDATNIDKLDAQMTEYLGVPFEGPVPPGTPPGTAPFGTNYSVCVFANNFSFLESKAIKLRDRIWMHGTDNWSLAAHIIAMDFLPRYTSLANASIVANVIKGTQLNAGNPMGPIDILSPDL